MASMTQTREAVKQSFRDKDARSYGLVPCSTWRTEHDEIYLKAFLGSDPQKLEWLKLPISTSNHCTRTKEAPRHLTQSGVRWTSCAICRCAWWLPWSLRTVKTHPEAVGQPFLSHETHLFVELPFSLCIASEERLPSRRSRFNSSKQSLFGWRRLPPPYAPRQCRHRGQPASHALSLRRVLHRIFPCAASVDRGHDKLDARPKKVGEKTLQSEGSRSRALVAPTSCSRWPWSLVNCLLSCSRVPCTTCSCPSQVIFSSSGQY